MASRSSYSDSKVAKGEPDYDILDCAPDHQIVLTGSPRALTARIPVRNTGDRRAVVRRATLRDPQGRLGERQFSARIPARVVRPDEAKALPVRVSIDPTTPPGEYELELEVAGSVRPALIRVAESVGVRLRPSTLVVENLPGTTHEKSVFLTNQGNVPVTVGEPGAIVLDDERLWCRVLRTWGSAIDARGAEALTLGEVAGEFLRSGDAVLDAIPPLRVRSISGPTTVNPGVTETIAFGIEVPPGLDQHTRYVGVYPIYTSDLTLMVVPGPGQSEER